jgi:hypothetical protein
MTDEDYEKIIEELEAENHLLKTSGIIEVAVRNPNVAEYIRHWEARAETAEAKLAEALVSLADLYRLHLRRGPSWDHPPTKEIMDKARTILVERKGQDYD